MKYIIMVAIAAIIARLCWRGWENLNNFFAEVLWEYSFGDTKLPGDTVLPKPKTFDTISVAIMIVDLIIAIFIIAPGREELEKAGLGLRTQTPNKPFRLTKQHF